MLLYILFLKEYVKHTMLRTTFTKHYIYKNKCTNKNTSKHIKESNRNVYKSTTTNGKTVITW